MAITLNGKTVSFEVAVKTLLANKAKWNREEFRFDTAQGEMHLTGDASEVTAIRKRCILQEMLQK